jgi:hypothetical protein
VEENARRFLTRRKVVVGGGVALATAFTSLGLVAKVARQPERTADASTRHHPRGGGSTGSAGGPSDIQFDVGAFFPAPGTVDGILLGNGPVHTVFATATLRRAPSRRDQATLRDALAQIEASIPWAPGGVFTQTAYGVPYFRKLNQTTVNRVTPRLIQNTRRSVLEEFGPMPTDVSRANPNIKKLRFNIPVRIERNDLVFIVRSDNATNIQDVLAWLAGSNTLAGAAVQSPRFDAGLSFTSSRAMFTQRGLPRKVAEADNLPFAQFMHPNAQMAMGFDDQAADAAAQAPQMTFQGASGFPRFTTARSGDYLDNGTIMPLTHSIEDMLQWYDMADPNTAPDDDGIYEERVQYAFTSPPINEGNADDQVANFGGPITLPNRFNGNDEAERTAQGIGITEIDPETGKPAHRIGHEAALHRFGRTSDGRPIHIRFDGTGYDDLDVPAGSDFPKHFKLQFAGAFPTANQFIQMRRGAAAQDLVQRFNVGDQENGFERFITTTRRQMFLMPPRRNRAFPMVELG